MLTDHRPHGDGLVAFGFIRELAARGHELHVAAGIVDVQGALPPNVHLYALRQEDGHGWAERLRFMWRVRRLYRRLTRSAAFDLVHQLTPVDVGVSLALADCSAPLVLGPYVPDWPPSGEGADAVVGPAALRRQARDPDGAAVARDHGLAVHAGRRVEAGAPAGAAAACPRASAGRGRPAPGSRPIAQRGGAGRALPGQPRGSQGHPRAPRRLRAAGHAAARRPPPDRRPGRRARRGASPHPRLVEPRPGGAARPRRARPGDGDHAELRRVLPAFVWGPVSAGGGRGDGMRPARRGHRRRWPAVPRPRRGRRQGAPGRCKLRLQPPCGEVLADPGLARAMGAHNRRVVEERYAWSRVVDGLEDLYGEAIREPRGSLTRRRRAGGSRWRAPARR